MVRYRVLLVDDNTLDLEMLSRCVSASPLHEFVVLTARSLQDGLDSVVALKPDCIVLDYVLGGTTGLEFITELRARGNFTPIVAVTGADPRTAATLIRAGAFDFISKDHAQVYLGEAILQAIHHTARANASSGDPARPKATADLRLAVERASYLAMASKRLASLPAGGSLVDAILQLALNLFGDVAFVDFVEERALSERQVLVSPSAKYVVPENAAWYPPSGGGDDGTQYVKRFGVPKYYNRSQLLALAHVDADIGFFGRQGLATLAIVPLATHTEMLGTLTVGSADMTEIGVDRRAVLEEFAQRAAIAIENARNAKAAREALEVANAARRRLNFQAQVSSMLVTSLDWRDTLQDLMRRITAFLCDVATVQIESGDRSLFSYGASASGTDEHARRRGAAGARETTRVPQEKRFGEYEMTVPMGNQKRTFGVLTLARSKGAEPSVPFDLDDLMLAEDMAHRVGAYLENAWAFEREKNIATTLQNSLFVKELPRVDGFEIAGRYIAGAPGMEVGGDWYDVMPIDRDRVAVALGDVAGRGVIAAAVMGQLRNLLRAYAFEGHAPGAALHRVNTLMNSMPAETFATIVYAIIDRREQTVRYSSAGHLPAIVADADGRVRMLDDARSLPVGVMPGIPYDEAVAPFPAGSTLLLFTDGLVETKERGVEEGVAEVVRTLSGDARTPEIMAGILLDRMVTHRTDDIALLAVRLSCSDESLRRSWSAARLDSRLASRLRSEISAYLEEYGEASDALHDAAVIVGELLSNVARYAPGKIEIEIDWTTDSPILHLKDYGAGYEADEPATLPVDAEEINGRGLFLISRLGRDFVFTAQGGEGTYAKVVLPIRRRRTLSPGNAA